MDRKTVLSSLIYKFIERFAVKGLGLIISILLARLLAPEDFGQVAIITVFINLSQTIIHGGFSSALVQKKDANETDFSTVFYIYMVIAGLLVALLWLLSPVIGAFYKSSEIVFPLRIYSISLIFGAFNSLQVARMQKKMRFRSMMICNLVATIISGTLGVTLAYCGAGLWALIVYYFANIVTTSIMMLIVEKWLPGRTFSAESAKSLFGFGWKMLVSSILCSLYADLRSLIIGKKFSTQDLGYYSKGQQFPNIISHTLDSGIQSVMFPTLATVQNTQQQLKAMLKRSVTSGAFVILPMMTGLAMVAEPFVRTVLTEKWLPCVVYMQLLCFADANISFTSSNMTAIKAMGRSDLYMKLEIVRRLAMLAVLCAALFLFRSVKAIAVSYLISAWLDVVIIMSVMKGLLNYGVIEQMRDNWKTFAATFLMGVSVYLIGFLKMNDVALMIIQIASGIVLYCVFCILLKVDSFFYVLNTFKNLVSKRK